MPFPPAANKEELERTRGLVLEAVSRRLAENRDWDIRFAEELRKDELKFMLEEQLVSPSFGERPAKRALAMSYEDSRCITVNEEDHVRIHAIMPGMQLEEAWKAVNGVDNELEREIQYSFDDKLGYLTSCPTNVGTGLRVSAMVHLPALVATGDIGRTVAALGQAGIYVRGLFGEGSGVAGNLFQIANRRTLGLAERNIIAYTKKMVSRLMEKEKTARKVMLLDSPLDLADRVYRSLGILERARRLSFLEGLGLLSMVKLGVEMEILPLRDFNILELEVEISNEHLRMRVGSGSPEEAIEEERAIHVRRLLDL
ncbi:MAG: ATP--guanido phosphotransferase [Actinomycetota bacterium]|nr:ATP--guanido phosphotransferase [Actinomycetota bacterium]